MVPNLAAFHSSKPNAFHEFCFKNLWTEKYLNWRLEDGTIKKGGGGEEHEPGERKSETCRLAVVDLTMAAIHCCWNSC